MIAYPKIPPKLSTIRSGARVERWKERRAILIAQRDIRQRWYARLTELLCEGAPVATVRRHTAASIDRLNACIQECNETLDSLGVTNPVVLMRPRQDKRRARGG